MFHICNFLRGRGKVKHLFHQGKGEKLFPFALKNNFPLPFSFPEKVALIT